SDQHAQPRFLDLVLVLDEQAHRLLRACRHRVVAASSVTRTTASTSTSETVRSRCPHRSQRSPVSSSTSGRTTTHGCSLAVSLGSLSTRNTSHFVCALSAPASPRYRTPHGSGSPEPSPPKSSQTYSISASPPSRTTRASQAAPA